MTVWIAIVAMAIIIFVLAIFYLVNSVHRYGKWITPVLMIIICLLIGIIGGIKIYKLSMQNINDQLKENTVVRTSFSNVKIKNGLQRIDEGSKVENNQQLALKNLQKSFENVGTISFNKENKTYFITPTSSQNIEAINYVLENHNKAEECGYTELTNSILETSTQIQNEIGKGYTLSLLKPNSDEIIYSAQDGKVLINVVK